MCSKYIDGMDIVLLVTLVMWMGFLLGYKVVTEPLIHFMMARNSLVFRLQLISKPGACVLHFFSSVTLFPSYQFSLLI